MLRSLKNIGAKVLETSDGELRSIKGFLFDDFSWVIRYVVADTGTWLAGRKVLISPVSLKKPPKGAGFKGRVGVELSKKQIEESPPLEVDRPVSRQYEMKLLPYYGWPAYYESIDGDPHLRSVEEVSGYSINAVDDEIGVADDFIIDDEDWSIKYVVVDTSGWNPLSKKVLLSNTWVKDIDSEKGMVNVDVTKKQVEESPEYDPSEAVNREEETVLYDYYGRPKYWLSEEGK